MTVSLYAGAVAYVYDGKLCLEHVCLPADSLEVAVRESVALHREKHPEIQAQYEPLCMLHSINFTSLVEIVLAPRSDAEQNPMTLMILTSYAYKGIKGGKSKKGKTDPMKRWQFHTIPVYADTLSEVQDLADNIAKRLYPIKDGWCGHAGNVHMVNTERLRNEVYAIMGIKKEIVVPGSDRAQ